MNILKKLISFIIPPKPQEALKRSPKWFKFRKKFIEENGGASAACGLKTNLEVHHIIPFAMKPEWELKKDNLIVLCENQSLFCHFVIGHSFSYSAYNPYVREDAALLRRRIKERLYKYKED